MNDLCPIKPRGLQRQVQRFRDVPDLHRCTELPGDDVAREVVQYRAEVKPAPADDLEIGEVGLPKLVRRSGIPHSSPSPSAIMLFLSRRKSRACSATTSFSARASRRRSLTSPLVAARAASAPMRQI